MLSYLVFKATFGNTIYYLHSTEKEETGSERLLNSLPRVILLVSSGDKIPTTGSVSSKSVYLAGTQWHTPGNTIAVPLDK